MNLESYKLGHYWVYAYHMWIVAEHQEGGKWYCIGDKDQITNDIKKVGAYIGKDLMDDKEYTPKRRVENMSIDYARDLLIRHNQWRRDEVGDIPDITPKQLGIAIDTIVEYIKNNENER